MVIIGLGCQTISPKCTLLMDNTVANRGGGGGGGDKVGQCTIQHGHSPTCAEESTRGVVSQSRYPVWGVTLYICNRLIAKNETFVCYVATSVCYALSKIYY